MKVISSSAMETIEDKKENQIDYFQKNIEKM